ncbi:MAG: 50S ribosomal protein L30 [Clostridiales bacterium]|nr:50S ribosomal protein L30 [Clostridiales bacterium]
MAQIKITLIKSRFGRIKKQAATLEAMGLRKIGASIVREDTPVIRGMIDRVSHLVKVEEVK